MNEFYRVLSGAPITPSEVRAAGIFALLWFFMDAFWFFGTVMKWF